MKLSRNNLIFFITLPFIVIIILGTTFISIASTIENKQLADKADTILSIPKAIKSHLKNHPTAYFNQNDNILELLFSNRLLSRDSFQNNSFGQQIQATAIDNKRYRVYAIVSPSVCRKLSSYLIKYDFSEFGLTGISVNAEGINVWTTVFSPNERETPSKIDSVCGSGIYSAVLIEFLFIR